MKIISKFKDYYDYLAGIYGVDEKLVLDRTTFFKQPYNPANYTVLKFWICGYLVEGIYIDGNFHYGKDIEKYAEIDQEPKSKQYNRYWSHREFYYTVLNPNRSRIPGRQGEDILKKPTLFKDVPKKYEPFRDRVNVMCPNDSENCPILVKSWDGFRKFPIMTDHQLNKVFDAFTMWTMLSEWLGRTNDIPDNQTNREKILSNGFDLKTSFRNPIK